MHICEIPPSDAPRSLLLLADPSEDKLATYLPQSRCFIALPEDSDPEVLRNAASGQDALGACAVQPLADGGYELMSIAVAPEHQRRGIGSQLLQHVIGVFRYSGAPRLEVGTGSFGYQLAFYQRHGFRVTAIDRDFFVTHYPQPIFEDGIQLRDMLRLTLELP